VSAQRLGVGAQALALGVFAVAHCPHALLFFVKGAAGLAQGAQQVDCLLALIDAEQPAILGGAVGQPARETAAAGQEQRVPPRFLLHRREEGAGALLCSGEEEEGRAEAVALAPGFGFDVLGIAHRLGLQAAVRHRAQVQLDEGEQSASIGVGDLDEGIGCDRPLLPAGPGGERLAGIGLAFEASQLHLGGQRRRQRHVDLAEASGVS
jgi:hypothetical protein